MLVGGLIAGSAADRLGRRYCLLVSLAVNCTFGAISAAAPSVTWLIAARVCAGLGEWSMAYGLDWMLREVARALRTCRCTTACLDESSSELSSLTLLIESTRGERYLARTFSSYGHTTGSIDIECISVALAQATVISSG